MAHPSMTGFGSAQIDCPSGRLGLEIRSVNSRFFELHPRLPDEFRWAESLLRDRVSSQIARGKIELRLSLSRTESTLSMTQISPSGLQSALRLAHEIRQEHPDIASFSVHELLKLPGVVVEPQLSQQEWSALLDGIAASALEQFSKNRIAEGEKLGLVISDRLQQIQKLCGSAKAQIPQAITAQQNRLSEKFREALASAAQEAADSVKLSALEERIRQEAAVYGLRIDIAEELDRLSAHLTAAHAALQSPPKPGTGIGKRLDFLTQEMNREANTLGSKAASIELSNISIEMKLLIEQIREQVQNLE
ncbi:MAG: YicC/YloC family endoribonuclease [Betaproteobacteria bacterium]|jgi:uncharacterized protein (TIGR00255 family)